MGYSVNFKLQVKQRKAQIIWESWHKHAGFFKGSQMLQQNIENAVGAMNC